MIPTFLATMLEAEKELQAQCSSSPSRELSISLTNLQTAILWAEKSLRSTDA